MDETNVEMIEEEETLEKVIAKESGEVVMRFKLPNMIMGSEL